MADRLDKLIAEVARSTYGAAQSWGKNARGGGLGASRGGINRGSPGYPVPDILDPKERPELEEGETPLAKSPVQDDPSKDPNKGFSDWGDELVEADSPKDLPKGIEHLEDLKPAEFLRFLEKYRDLPLKGGLEVSEKVDGSARISFGAEGAKVWTQSKNGDKKYSSAEYPDTPMYRAIKAAHKALESKAAQLGKGVPPDTFFVAEVLYTKIPNSIEYGPNVIMIHGVHRGGQTLSDEESRKVANAAIKAAGGQLSDGKDKWKFEYKRTVDPKDVMVDVKKEFDSLKDVYAELKRLEPDRLKAAGKGNYKNQLEQFKAIQIAVKKKLLGQLRKQKSAYGPEGGDVEGLVFRDLESGAMVKLVDKEYFTALNKFLWQYREMLDKGLKVGDKWEFGIMQKFRNAIADEVLGAPVAKTPGFVKMLAGRPTNFPPGADTPQKRADVVLASYIRDEKLMQGDFVKSFRTETEKVHKEFEKLRKEWDEKKKGDLTFSAKGKTVKMDPLIKDRTDEAFDGMEQFFKTVFGALQTIGALRGELTKKVGLLKIMMGQQRFERLVGAVGGQQEESMVREAAEPGEGGGKLTFDEQKNLAYFAASHYKKLKKRKIDVAGMKRLGSGSNGVAMLLRDGRIFKITYDKSEALASMAVKGKKLKHVIRIEDVFQFPPPRRGESNVYAIVQERLETIPNTDKEEFTGLVVDVEVESGMHSKIWQLPSWEEIVSYGLEGAEDYGGPEKKQHVAQALKTLKDKFQMDGMTADLRSANIQYRDFHGGNIGKRGNDHVVMDLGYSKSKGAKPPMLEQVTEAVIDMLEAEADSYAATEPKTAQKPTSGFDKTSVAKTQQKGQAKAKTGVTTAIAQQILQKSAPLLAKRGINARAAKPLGQGTRGVAFDVGSNRVLKITNDEQEAVASYKLMDVALKHVARFSDVFRFREDEELVGAVYGILQEKLTPFPGMGKDPSGRDAGGEAADLNRAILAFNLQETIYKSGGNWDKVKEACQQQIWDKIGKQYPNWKSDEIDKKYAIEYAKKMNAQWDTITKKVHIDEMVQELNGKGIKFHDYHAGNIMVRANGDYVLIDIGYSKVAGGKEPPVLERIMREMIGYLDESGGMRGIGGSMPTRFMGPSPARKQDEEDIDEQKPSFPDDRQEYVGVVGGPNPAENGEMDRFAEAVMAGITEAGDDGSKEFGDALMKGLKSKTQSSPLKKRVAEAPADKVGVTIGRYQPFHAGHAAVIRRLAGQFNKVIVIIAGNKVDKKNPFSFETRLDLMKRSLPDVFSKLEIHKATVGGKASGFIPGVLSDIIRDKKSTIKPDTAIEVLVGPDREADIKQQFDRARQYKETGKEDILFDPDMAIVRGLPGVKNDDDTDRISGTKVRDAIAKGDKDAAKKLLDPHLVSNPQEFEELFARMQDELRTNAGGPTEGINEDLSDVGEAGIMAIINANAEKLENHKPYPIHVKQLRKLGAGQMGIAFDMGGGKVFKVTTSESEAFSNNSLVGKTFPNIVHVYEVFQMEDRRQQKVPIYGIIRENLHPLTPQEKTELDELVDLMRDNSIISITANGDFPQMIQAVRALLTKEIRRDLQLGAEPPGEDQPMNKREVRAKTLIDQKMATLEPRLRHFQIDKMMQQLKSVGVRFADYKGDNVMRRGGLYVLSDVGGGKSAGAKPKMLEQIIEDVINEIGITFNTNTPGGTQTGLRAGSSGWSAPMGMYTDDDVEAARENPDEFEVWSDKLARLQNKAIGEK